MTDDQLKSNPNNNSVKLPSIHNKSKMFSIRESERNIEE